VNCSGWVLRNLGATREAEDQHVAALEIGRGHGTAELTIAALEDLAEQALDGGDPDRAAGWLAQASDLLQGDIVFGWRLNLKRQLLAARLALLRGDPEQAAAQAGDLELRAQDLALPRYVSVARLVRHRANIRLGQPSRPEQVEADLDLLDSSVAIEAWWWTGDVAADVAVPRWLDRAAERAGRLARRAGRYGDGLRLAAGRRQQDWQAIARSGPAA
jgi:hypothetical protein